MPGILPMKVIKVGTAAQSRIAQACDRCRSKKSKFTERSDQGIANISQYDAMESGRAAASVPTLASSARQATS